jgi:hypothetical protein
VCFPFFFFFFFFFFPPVNAASYPGCAESVAISGAGVVASTRRFLASYDAASPGVSLTLAGARVQGGDSVALVRARDCLGLRRADRKHIAQLDEDDPTRPVAVPAPFARDGTAYVRPFFFFHLILFWVQCLGTRSLGMMMTMVMLLMLTGFFFFSFFLLFSLFFSIHLRHPFQPHGCGCV